MMGIKINPGLSFFDASGPQPARIQARRRVKVQRQECESDDESGSDHIHVPQSLTRRRLHCIATQWSFCLDRDGSILMATCLDFDRWDHEKGFQMIT